MNTRERFIKTLLFDRPDRPYFHHAFGLMPGVIERWHQEGLPEDVGEDDIRTYFSFDLKGRGMAVNLLFDPSLNRRSLRKPTNTLSAGNQMAN